MAIETGDKKALGLEAVPDEVASEASEPHAAGRRRRRGMRVPSDDVPRPQAVVPAREGPREEPAGNDEAVRDETLPSTASRPIAPSAVSGDGDDFDLDVDVDEPPLEVAPGNGAAAPISTASVEVAAAAPAIAPEPETAAAPVAEAVAAPVAQSGAPAAEAAAAPAEDIAEELLSEDLVEDGPSSAPPAAPPQELVVEEAPEDAVGVVRDEGPAEEIAAAEPQPPARAEETGAAARVEEPREAAAEAAAEELDGSALEEVSEEEPTSSPAATTPAAAPAPPAKKPPPAPPAAAVIAAATLEARPRKRRGKAWFEEVFDEDYLRTLPFLTSITTQREAAFLIDVLGLKPGQHVLDVGCGYGRHAMEIAARGHSVVALDLSLPLLLRGADEAQRRGLSINFVHGDMREMRYDAQFDAAYCVFSTFGYFDDDSNKRTAQLIARALRPGGRLVLDLLNRDYIIADLPTRVWWEGDGCVVLEEVDFNYFTSRLVSTRSIVFDDGRQVEQEISIRSYSLHEVGKLLHGAGFRVLSVSGGLAARGRFFGKDSRQIIVVAERRSDGAASREAAIPPAGPPADDSARDPSEPKA